jgi:hypothetical protein
VSDLPEGRMDARDRLILQHSKSFLSDEDAEMPEGVEAMLMVHSDGQCTLVMGEGRLSKADLAQLFYGLAVSIASGDVGPLT